MEHDIRQFLDVVEDEMRNCRTLLEFCSARWRDLALPTAIDRRDIVSDGYKYGEFRFELERESVLELFVGARLYEDRYVFVRELIQNAFDAVRLREFIHGPNPHARVDVTCWEDASGFLWLRVDDTGVGMDEETIRQYFLKVGRSYYRSSELKADLLRNSKANHEFVAISRFGIGVLSCFIAGDLVELSTRRIKADGTLADAIRLSLAKDEDYFVLREKPTIPEPLPGRSAPELGYRTAPGTSIAVRIDPTKSDVEIETLAERLRDYVLCPPVDVYFNGAPMRDLPADFLDRPLLPEPVIVESSVQKRMS